MLWSVWPRSRLRSGVATMSDPRRMTKAALVEEVERLRWASGSSPRPDDVREGERFSVWLHGVYPDVLRWLAETHGQSPERVATSMVTLALTQDLAAWRTANGQVSKSAKKV